jgi:ribosomal-protein-alanine N-acetyltransferase
MSADLADRSQARWVTVTEAMLDDVLPIENRAYTHPWTRGNFVDSLNTGYQIQAIYGGDTLVGYFVAMQGVGEVHLLNITVAPEFQGQGWAVMLLDALAIWSRSQGAEMLWLEVRVSNARAQQVYERYGFTRVGARKNYYPVAASRREDAVVMSFRL